MGFPFSQGCQVARECVFVQWMDKPLCCELPAYNEKF